jgi:hypothetical protein
MWVQRQAADGRQRSAAASLKQSVAAGSGGASMRHPVLDLEDIQGDILVCLQKDAERFIFFKIIHQVLFKKSLRQYVIAQITNTK